MDRSTRVIDTYVLDSLRGGLAAGIPVRLEAERPDGSWEVLGSGVTGTDGGSGDLSGAGAPSGSLRFVYDAREYWSGLERPPLFPRFTIAFEAPADDGDYDLVVLLGPYGYTTYRGD